MSANLGVPHASLPMRMHTPDPWRDHAECAHENPELFFPDHGRDNIEAKMVCLRCPVAAQCLDYALTHYEAGIWGGTTEYERRGLRSATRTNPGIGVPRPKSLRGRQIPDLAQRMRAWRLTHGLTQHAVAQQYGITKNMVADYETGRSTPNRAVRARIDTIIGGTP